MNSGRSHNTAQRLTSATPGAIAVLALSGPASMAWVQQHFRTPNGKTVSQWPTAAVRFGRWQLDSQHAEELLVAHPTDSTFELHCHAGVVAQTILDQLELLGATILEPLLTHETFTRLTLEQQAQQLLLRATTETAAAILLDQFRGALRGHLSEILALLNHGALLLAQTRTEELLRFAPIGAHLCQPWEIQLAGPPNVGKSSLLNSILGYQRAIVHDSAGTTRDLVHATTSLGGWPFRFTDSAGIRDDADLGEAELIGIERAMAAAQTMDAILLVIEPTDGITATHRLFLDRFADKTMLVLNQIDRLSANEQAAKAELWQAIPVSALTGDGLSLLLDKLHQRLITHIPEPGQAIPFLPQHLHALSTVLSAIKVGEIEAATLALRELMGPL